MLSIVGMEKTVNKYCKGNFSFMLEVCPSVDGLSCQHFCLTTA